MTVMRYDAEQVDFLAAEYVLGTLHGAARRRFDRLMTDRADVRFAVWRWERHLNGFVNGLRPQKPKPHVWKNIRQRIRLTQSAGSTSIGGCLPDDPSCPRLRNRSIAR